ncbi:MAG TPA: type IV secretion system protein, partial [Streptosporangiaceae bacterium]|nr:type IV secretion system protein [Streptosporangiaceae bacterium]
LAAVHSPATVTHAAATPVRATAGPAHAAAVPARAITATAHARTAVLLAARSPDGSGLTAQPASAAVAAGGICQVPGIGDIGGLLGFCAGGSGLTGDLNNICQPSLPNPEPATAGIDSLVRPPASATPVPRTLYNEDGVSGQYWAATNLQCSDMTSLIGNNVAGMVFDVAKSIDRVTITVYQSAAGEGILSWLKNSVDRLITSLGNAIYFPYLAVVVILGAIWLAWHGLIRKRGTRSLEGTIWMVVAAAAAIWLIGRPADFTGIGKTASDGITQTLNVAFSKLPNPGSGGCVPLQRTDPQAQASFGYTSGSSVVDQNAGELWSVLVCKPWLDGEFGTTSFAATPGGQQTVINAYARQLLWAQTIAANEKPTAALIKAKQATYAGIAQSIQQNDPGVYPLFQGKEWTTRLEIAFAALFAAVVAGVLVLLIAVTLILLKLGFLLLLVVGPFFLLIGTHPGFGRVVALRWLELLIGVLLKQAAVALVLSVLVYSYALIMGTSDAVLPWALKILMIALVTIAVFIYRRPFQHLFSAVGYGVIGSRERANADLAWAGSTLRANTRSAATAVPGFAAYRAARWARRNPAQAAGLAASGGAGGSGAGAAAARAAAAQGTAAGMPDADGAVVLAGQDGYPPDLAAAASGAAGHAAAGNGTDVASGGSRPGVAARARSWAASAGGGSGRSAPPLNLPPRNGSGAPAARGGSGAAPSGWARNGGEGGNDHHGGLARSGSAGYSGPPGRSAAAGRGDPGPASGPAAPAPAVSGPAAPAWRPAFTARSTPRHGPAGPDPAAGGSGGRGAPPARLAPSVRSAPPVRSAGAGRAAAALVGQPAVPAAGPGTGPFAGSQAEGQGPAPMTPFWLRPIRRRK